MIPGLVNEAGRKGLPLVVAKKIKHISGSGLPGVCLQNFGGEAFPDFCGIGTRGSAKWMVTIAPTLKMDFGEQGTALQLLSGNGKLIACILVQRRKWPI
jgi:hypothetical protein